MNMAVESLNWNAAPITGLDVNHSKKGAFAEELQESSIDTIIKEIHDKFGIDVGKSGQRYSMQYKVVAHNPLRLFIL